MVSRAVLDERRSPASDSVDHVICFRNASWDDYERVLAMRGDRSAPRISYLKGQLEIMSPSRDHEDIKSLIGRLVEAYCFEHGIRFTALGSWTLKKKADERGAEADECYQIGEGKKTRPPELAIEVEWTSGRIDKLDIYRKLGVREVWIWSDGKLTPYRLSGERYRRARVSRVIAGIDLAELLSFTDRETTYDAVRAYRSALRRRGA